MKISCPNCDKNFIVDDDLIPKEGRKLQCGSCQHGWFFNKPTDSKKDEITNIDKSYVEKEGVTIKNSESNKKNKTKEFNFEKKNEEEKFNKPKKSINILKFILVIIITFIAIIIVIETFKNQISIFFPGILDILDNLFLTLNDIELFIKDLVK